MTTLETMAVILAALVLAKIVTISINPRAWYRLVRPIWDHPMVSTIVYALLAVLTGWYVLQELTVAQVGAAALFFSFLFALSFFPYIESMRRLRDEVMQQGIWKAWFPLVLWTAFAIWVLVEVL